MTMKLDQAAKALLAHWDTPAWKYLKPTGDLIADLREALAEPKCWCETCRPITMDDMRMVLCPTCGNKRCPHATDHRNACTGSNKPGQKGSSYEHCKPAEQAEQEPVAEALRLSEEAIEYARQGGKIGSGIYGKALAAIRSAKEPQITTPDVCGEVCVRAKLCYGCGKALDEANAKFTEQAEQEPVAIIEKEAGFETEVYATGHAASLPDGVFKLYASPVRIKDLTDDEIMKINVDTASIVPTCDRQFHFARAVISADREKNK